MADLNQRPEAVIQKGGKLMKAGQLLSTQSPTNMFTRSRSTKRKKAPSSSASSTIQRVIKSLFNR